MERLEKSGVTLQIGNLLDDVDEDTLYEKFQTHGKISSTHVYRDPETDKSLGYADVNYEDISDANSVIEKIRGKSIYGKPCRIVLFRRDPTRSQLRNILVKNLHPTITTEEIHDTFSFYGEILSCKVETDENGVSKGFAFVTFSRKIDAEKVVEVFDGKIIRDKIVSVAMLFPEHQRKESEEYFRNLSKTNIFAGTPQRVVLTQKKEDREAHLRSQLQPTVHQPLRTSRIIQVINPDAERLFLGRPGNIVPKRWPPNVSYMTSRNNIVGMPANENLMKTGLPQQRDILVDPMMNQNKNARPITGNVQMNQARPQSNMVANGRPAAMYQYPMQDNQQMMNPDKIDLSTTSKIANADSMEAKQLLGEKIYPLISKIAGDMAGKITGMFLELDNAELLYMIENENSLRMKIDEALIVLNAHKRGDVEERNKRSITDKQQINHLGSQQSMAPNHIQTMKNSTTNPKQMKLPEIERQTNFMSNSKVSSADSKTAKQLLGEKIYPLISKIAGDMAGKITGMFLELDNAELLYMIENENSLRMKIDEALKVLNAHKGSNGEERNKRSITDNVHINQVRPQHKVSTNGLPDLSQHPMPITKRINEASFVIDSNKTIVERNVNRVDDTSMGHTAEKPSPSQLKQTSNKIQSCSSLPETMSCPAQTSSITASANIIHNRGASINSSIAIQNNFEQSNTSEASMSRGSSQSNQHKGVPIDRIKLTDVKSQLDNQSLGETIYASVHRIAGYTNAGKITDKLLELGEDELNYLIENEDGLIKKIDETLLDINDEDNVRMKTQHKEFLDMYKTSLLSQLKEMECAINDYFSELQCISCDNRLMHQFDDFLSSFSK